MSEKKWYSYMLSDGKFVTFAQWMEFFEGEKKMLIADGIHIEDGRNFWCWCRKEELKGKFGKTKIEHKL